MYKNRHQIVNLLNFHFCINFLINFNNFFIVKFLKKIQKFLFVNFGHFLNFGKFFVKIFYQNFLRNFNNNKNSIFNVFFSFNKFKNF